MVKLMDKEVYTCKYASCTYIFQYNETNEQVVCYITPYSKKFSHSSWAFYRAGSNITLATPEQKMQLLESFIKKDFIGIKDFVEIDREIIHELW